MSSVAPKLAGHPWQYRSKILSRSVNIIKTKKAEWSDEIARIDGSIADLMGRKQPVG